MENYREDIKNKLLKNINDAIEEQETTGGDTDKIHLAVDIFSDFISALAIESSAQSIKE